MKTKTINCYECGGRGDGESSCCSDYIGFDGKRYRCEACNKFTSWRPCEVCEGSGKITFYLNSKVSIWLLKKGYKEALGISLKKKASVKGKLVCLEPLTFSYRKKEVKIIPSDIFEIYE